MIQLLKYSLAYFVIVVSFGFIFGVIRVMLVAPYLGEQLAEILEAPLMIMVSYLTARYTLLLMCMAKINVTAFTTISIGFIALLYLLVTELTLVLWVRNIQLADYLYSKYSLAGLAYFIALVLFAIFPYVVFRYPPYAVGKKLEL